MSMGRLKYKEKYGIYHTVEGGIYMSAIKKKEIGMPGWLSG